MLSNVPEHPPFISSSSIKWLFNAAVCAVKCTELGHNGACEVSGLGREKDINQIDSQINMITNCVKSYEGGIPRGRRASERAIWGEIFLRSHIEAKP